MSKRFFSPRSSNKTTVPSPLAANPPMLAHKKSSETVDSVQRPQSPLHSNPGPRRTGARCRDSFNKAKVHVRRPPKGITHWFEALDDDSSDDDYPEVVEDHMNAPSVRSMQPSFTSFQPSLGPHRARAAPTSRVSQSADGMHDYFSYSSPRRRKHSRGENDLHLISEDPNDRSVLDLSSDEETPSRATSPAVWELMTPSPGMHSHAFRSGTMQRKVQTLVNPWRV